MFRLASFIAVLILIPLVCPAQTMGCQEVKRRDATNLTVYLSGNEDAPIEASVLLGGVMVGRTTPDGRCDFTNAPCSGSEWIEVRPTSPNYCRELQLCVRGSIPIKIRPGCSIVAALEKEGGTVIPWAGDLSYALSGNLGKEFGADGQFLDKLSLEARALYSTSNFAETATVARNMTVAMLDSGASEAAMIPAILQIDAAFRAVGLEPAGEADPLIVLSGESGTFMLTSKGEAALKLIDPGSEIFAGSIPVLSESGLAKVEALATGKPAILHPDLIPDLGEYLSVK